MERQLIEFLVLAENALGSHLDEHSRRSLRKIQKDFLRQQTQLVRVLDLGASGGIFGAIEHASEFHDGSNASRVRR
jgi:hypothetical protein